MIEAVIFDYARTIVDVEKEPPELFPGVEEMLEGFKVGGLRLALVSTGQDPNIRRQEFERLGLTRFFEVLTVVGATGTKEFQPILDKLGVEASRCVVVGDRVKSEILQGNKVGATTVWLQQGKFAADKPKIPEEQPTYSISSLLELNPIIESLS